MLGMMTALEIVFERLLVIETPITRFSLTFLPRAVCGACLGPLYGAVVGGIADVLGGIMKGFTINPFITGAAVLRGITYGCLLFKKQTPVRIIIASALDQFVAGLVVTTIGLVVYGFLPMNIGALIPRLVQSLILFVLEVLLLIPFRKILFTQTKKAMEQRNDERF